MQPSVWSACIDHVWDTVRVGLAVRDVATKLIGLDVAQAMPVLSSPTPLILITPVDPGDAERVKRLLDDIRVLLGVDSTWTSIPAGPYYHFRLRADNVNIDVASYIPTHVENKFEIL